LATAPFCRYIPVYQLVLIYCWRYCFLLVCLIYASLWRYISSDMGALSNLPGGESLLFEGVCLNRIVQQRSLYRWMF